MICELNSAVLHRCIMHVYNWLVTAAIYNQVSVSTHIQEMNILALCLLHILDTR